MTGKRVLVKSFTFLSHRLDETILVPYKSLVHRSRVPKRDPYDLRVTSLQNFLKRQVRRTPGEGWTLFTNTFVTPINRVRPQGKNGTRGEKGDLVSLLRSDTYDTRRSVTTFRHGSITTDRGDVGLTCELVGVSIKSRWHPKVGGSRTNGRRTKTIIRER